MTSVAFTLFFRFLPPTNVIGNFRSYSIVTVKSRKLRYFGHIIRHELLNRVLLEGQLEGTKIPWTTEDYMDCEYS